METAFFVMIIVVVSIAPLAFLVLIESDTFTAIDKRFASYISAVGKDVSSGRTAPVPKTPPVKRPLTDEDIMSVQPMVPVKTNLVFEYTYAENEE